MLRVMVRALALSRHTSKQDWHDTSQIALPVQGTTQCGCEHSDLMLQPYAAISFQATPGSASKKM